MNYPILISDYTGGETLNILVRYDWINSPHKDFTLKLYSQHTGTMIYDDTGNTNMLHTDGQEPSEFTNNPGVYVPPIDESEVCSAQLVTDFQNTFSFDLPKTGSKIKSFPSASTNYATIPIKDGCS
jgi:hypothetical protein